MKYDLSLFPVMNRIWTKTWSLARAIRRQGRRRIEIRRFPGASRLSSAPSSFSPPPHCSFPLHTGPFFRAFIFTTLHDSARHILSSPLSFLFRDPILSVSPPLTNKGLYLHPNLSMPLIPVHSLLSSHTPLTHLLFAPYQDPILLTSHGQLASSRLGRWWCW